ncbi:MAG: hypothetical protein QXE31_02165 [Candidatus Woesearchaeota archaeon]
MAIFSDLKKLEEELEKDKSIEALKLLIEYFKEKYNLSTKEILNIVSIKDNDFFKEKDEEIPLKVFYNKKLSALEIIVKYLKENLNMSYHQIAVLLNRDDRTVWTTYNKSLKKQKSSFNLGSQNMQFNNINIPLSIFSNRKKSVLENLVIYLKDNLRFSFKEISELLLKDYQTIYTTYKKGIHRK